MGLQGAPAMTIYSRLGTIHSIVKKHPELGLLIEQVHLETEGLNPAVRNARFRQLFESYGVPYHKQGYSPKEIYHRTKNNVWTEQHCEMCGQVIDSRAFNSRHCGSKCANGNPKTQTARNRTVQQRYGVDNVFQSATVKDAVRETCLREYGAEHYSQTDAFAASTRKTRAKHSDEKKKEINQKKIKTWQKNYGVDHCSKAVSVRKKTKSTNLERYGAENPNQVPQFHTKGILSRRNYKVYTFPSGRTYNVQGFEPKAIDILLESGYTEEQIQLTGRPGIKYFWSSSDGYGDDKWHVHHPDIVLPLERQYTYRNACGTH